MSVRVRSMAQPATPGTELLEKLVSISVEGLLSLGQRLGQALAPAPGASLQGRVTRASRTRCECGCCDIPEQDCPPRCVCEIRWEGVPGGELACTLRITNASAKTRTFDLTGTELTGPAGTLAAPTVTPAQLTLTSGRSGLAQATLVLPMTAAAGDYEGELLIQGAYEQSACVRVAVAGAKTCGCGQRECRCGRQYCACEVVQGDPPVRIRAHHWYDHFQCTELCECGDQESQRA